MDAPGAITLRCTLVMSDPPTTTRLEGGAPDTVDESGMTTQSVITPGAVARQFSAASREKADAISFRPVDADAYTRGPELARGGMGRISAAHDRRLGRPVAIKELLSRDPETVARFEREARITGRLQHPAVVPIYEAGTWPDGEPFYAMKLIEGDSLSMLLARCTTLNERLALLPHIIDVANALAYAHAQRIVHRDLKPANVIIGTFGETMVIDWGLAKPLSEENEPAAVADAADLHSDLTVAGKILGTPAFMAPEQAQLGPVDERVDVYALGAILYHLLTGQRPYAEITPGREVLAKILSHPPAPVASLAPDAPPELITITAKAMARNPAERYPSAAELAAELTRYQTGKLLVSHRYSRWSLIRRFLRRHRVAALVVAAGVAVLAATGTVSVQRIIDERNRARRARADAELARADAQAAQAHAEQQTDELMLLQARAALQDDPTATLAWLGRARIDAHSLGMAASLLDEAEARGVARHVLHYGDRVWDVSFAPDGRSLAVATGSGEVEVVDVATGHRTPITRAGVLVHTVRFSPDGKRLVMGSMDDRVRVWHRDTGAVVALTGLTRLSVRVGFSEDSSQVYASDLQPRTCIWDLADPVSTAPADCLPGIVSVDGGHLALTPEPGGMALVHLRTRAVLRRWPGTELTFNSRTPPGGMDLITIDPDGWLQYGDHTGAVRRLSPGLSGRNAFELSPNGRWMAADPENTVITLWDTKLGGTRKLHGHQGKIRWLTFSRDGSFLLSLGSDETVRLWDLRSRDVLVLRGHTDDLKTGALDPTGAHVATGDNAGTVRIWSARGGPGKVLGGALIASDIAAFPAADTLVTTTADGGVTRWQTGTRRAEQLRAGRADDHTLRMSLAPTSLLAVAGADQAPIEIWDPIAGTHREVRHRGRKIEKVAAPADGSRVALADAEGWIMVESRAGKEQRSWQVAAPVCALAFSPDGTELAALGLLHAERWDVTSGRLIASHAITPAAGFCNGSSSLTHVEYSPDGRYLAIMRWSKVMLVWDLASGTLDPIDIPDSGTAVAFSPDSALLAVSTADHTVRLWQLAERRQRVLGAHQDTIHFLAFSPDGDLLASASGDGTIRLWQPHTGAVKVLRGHTGAVRAAAFSADGRSLASTGEDGSIRVWDPHRPPIEDPAALRAHIARSTTAVLGSDRGVRTPAIMAPSSTPQP
jgi:WD40 repeat protein/serine/threonine protein kinase